MTFNPRSYGPAVVNLLKQAPCNELGPGEPVTGMRLALAALSSEGLAAPHHVRSCDMALACIAGLWLRFDFLDESHQLSQSIENASGSFWHGIMHRREPDFSNAKYWFRRVGLHPIFPALNQAAAQLAREAPPLPVAAYLTRQADWDPLQFVDLCEYALDDSPPIHTLCRRIQQREWELLFDYCYREAIEE